jgi:hypothetical protein
MAATIPFASLLASATNVKLGMPQGKLRNTIIACMEFLDALKVEVLIHYTFLQMFRQAFLLAFATCQLRVQHHSHPQAAGSASGWPLRECWC